MKVRYNSETGRLGKAYPDTMLVPNPYIVLTTQEVNNIANQTDVQKYARDAQLLVVDSLVTTPEYDKMIARISH